MGERVAVIGAGVFGAWTAWHLLQRGCDVVLVDAHGPGNSLSSSGGESRIIRAAYGKDSIYSWMAVHALPQWRELAAASGQDLFYDCGVLFLFGDGGEPYLCETIEAHRDLGLGTALIDRAGLDARYPMVDFAGIEAGLFEPGFGALMARRAVRALVARFVAAGGHYVHGVAQMPAADADHVAQVALGDGEAIAADRFVIATGAWLPPMLPEVIGGRIRATRQEVLFFAAPAGDVRFLPGAMPVWADFNGGDMYYGMPDIEGRGVKFAHDAHGPPTDPETQDRRASPEVVERMIAFRNRRFPALRGAPLSESRVCQYENSSNGDFLIDLHPRWDNVLLVGAGSGHGFKHGPEVGRMAAMRLFGDGAAEARFTLAAKSEHHRRTVI